MGAGLTVTLPIWVAFGQLWKAGEVAIFLLCYAARLVTTPTHRQVAHQAKEVLKQPCQPLIWPNSHVLVLGR